MGSPKHNRLGGRMELILVSAFLVALVIWLCTGTPGLPK